MRIGIIGLPFSGKTTFFQLLSDRGMAGSMSGKKGMQIATVFIPDQRLDHLSSVYQPKKKTHASLEFFDTPSLPSRHGDDRRSASSLDELYRADSFCLMIREFESPSVPMPSGKIEGIHDVASIMEDFILADLQRLEKETTRLKKITRSQKGAAEEKILTIIEKAMVHLEEESPIWCLSLSDSEDQIIAGYSLLTAKPLLVIVNISEDQIQQADRIAMRYKKQFPDIECIVICASLEQELSQLDIAEAKEFMRDLGIVDSAFDRIIKACFSLTGLMVFFTAGSDECRAWTIKENTTAYDAAGKIHSDIQRGFIRAMVLPYESFHRDSRVQVFREKALQHKKDYCMQDGDIVEYKFSV